MAAVLTDPGVRVWLARALAGQRIVAVRQLAGGYRNDNVLLVTDAAEKYVLRRYRGEDVEATGRTCGVEAALAARLRGIVPVPEVIAADPAGSAAGEPLLLSRYVAGSMVSEVLARPDGAGAGPAGQPAGDAGRAAGDAGRAAADLGRAAGAVLAAIGSVRFGGPGFFTGPDLIPSAEGMPASLPDFVEDCLRAAGASGARAVGGLSGGLSPAEQDGLRALAARAGPAAARADGCRQLVHSDYNPKNLLAVHRGGQWSITAVLDWEFAYSGSPLADIGNMLRPRPGVPAEFAAGFSTGYREAGGELPDGWREISEALDLYALADFLTRPPGHRYFRQAVVLIRERLARS
jgi:aminoglycoside phosphotransferase (APT) family kinase protein